MQVRDNDLSRNRAVKGHTQFDYRNEGHAIRYHANSYEVIFYDKLKDPEHALQGEAQPGAGL